MMRIMPTIAASFIGASLQRPAALDQLENQHHNRNDQQDMNESPKRVGDDQPKQPEHQQDHEYCPEHKVSFRLSHMFLRPMRFRCAYGNWNFCTDHGFVACSVTGHDYSFSTTARRFQSAAS